MVDNDRVEGVDEPELLNTQPVIDLDVNDASTSDEENGPSHGKTRLVERDESLVSHNSVDHGLENTAAAKSSPDPLPEPTLALLRRLNQVRIIVYQIQYRIHLLVQCSTPWHNFSCFTNIGSGRLLLVISLFPFVQMGPATPVSLSRGTTRNGSLA